MNVCLARRQTRTSWELPLLRSNGAPIWKNDHRQNYGTTEAARADPKNIVREKDSLHFSWGSGSQISTKARSLVRSILREASYLPDPNARQFVKARTLHQSRGKAFRAWEHRDDPEFAARGKKDATCARSTLSRLRRANEGERSALLHVLFMTYGRIGSRRYELLRSLYQKDRKLDHDMMKLLHRHQSESSTQDHDSIDSPEDGQATEHRLTDGEMALGDLHDHSTKPSDDTMPVLTPEIYALAKSQKLANPPTHTRKNPRHLKPSIPAINARMLPMPRSRLKNMRRKWYADFLNRILPPLPTNEWEQLRAWSRGQDLPTMIIPRRLTPAPRLHFGTSDTLEAVVVQGRIDKAVYDNREAHEITPRFMQRLWATVFSTCPYMFFDDIKNERSVLWGHHELAEGMVTELQKVMDEETLPTP